MGIAAALGEALERLRLLERGEILTLKVLDARKLQHLGLIDVADDDRQVAEPHLHRRLIAALAGDNLEPLAALARDIRLQIQKVFGGKVFKTVITKSVRLEESPAYKESIFTFAPDSTGASEYYRLCEEVIDRA